MLQTTIFIILGSALCFRLLDGKFDETDYCQPKFQCGKEKNFRCKRKVPIKPENCSSHYYDMFPEKRKKVLDDMNVFRSNLVDGVAKCTQATETQLSNMRQLTWDHKLEYLSMLAGSDCRRTDDASEYDQCATTSPLLKIPCPEEIFASYADPGPSQFLNYPNLTAIGWARTHKVGCTYVVCKGCTRELRPGDPTTTVKETIEYWVCFFGTKSNVVGEPPFETGPPCSQCPEGTKCSHSNLCALPTDPQTPVNVPDVDFGIHRH